MVCFVSCKKKKVNISRAINITGSTSDNSERMYFVDDKYLFHKQHEGNFQNR